VTPAADALSRTHEAVSSRRWLLKMRWLAGAGVLAAAWAAASVLHLGLDPRPLYVLGASILLYNALLWFVPGRYPAAAGAESTSYRRFTHLQMGLDWLAMIALVHYSGGIESPVVFFFVFHIVIASLLFGRWTAFAYAAAALALTAGLAVLEAEGVIRHLHVAGFLGGEAAQEPVFAAGILATLAVTSLVTWYLTSSIAAQVRRREHQLANLYAGMRAINSTLDLREVLTSLVRATVEAMGLQGGSIGLLDASGTQVELAASHGLSEAYLDKGPVLLSQSPVHAQVVASGVPAIVQSEADRLRLQYPAAAETENIRSLIVVPLKGKGRPLGVLRAYSSRPEAFGREEAQFLEAIAAQGAVAIENAMAFQALRQLDAEKSRFTRVVTHELRAPVTGAQTLLNFVLDGHGKTMDAGELRLLVQLRERMQSLQLLIDDLLDLAAGRAGLVVEQVKPLRLGDLLDQLVAQHLDQARARSQTLTLTRDDTASPLLVEASTQGLTRVFTNLIGNAVKYTPQGGAIEVALGRRDQYVSVAVADTGIGIPAESMGSLFKEFYRAPNAKLRANGTGLGLVIIKELVERFRGRIAVESVEDRGSTFTVFLPLAGGDPPPG
jgi:signal transduction histidine kinase